jgi:3-deoxy-D-manno-octulosonic-acid transferase
MRIKIYRLIQRYLVLPFIVRSRVTAERYNAFLESQKAPESSVGVWFHAASVGELETLIPLMDELPPHTAIAVTVFSQSAIKNLESLPAQFLGGAILKFKSYAPWDGAWQSWFKALKPKLFVTARYENWPELWGGAALENVPLFILGLRDIFTMSTSWPRDNQTRL